MIQSLADQFNAGGPFMWAILAAFAVACAVVLERMVYYYVVNRKSAGVVEAISAALRDNNPDRVKEIISTKRTPLFRLLGAGIERFLAGANIAKVQEGIEEAAIEELPKISLRLSYLALLANVATLLGLLGTIAGLQVSFSSLATVDAAQKASMLANGISQAMITTAFGLIVAIPCMVMYTALNNKKQDLVKEIDSSVVKLVNFMKEQAA